MFGIDLPEFLLILAVAIVVIGPKDLPRVLYTAGKMMRKVKKLSYDVQKSIEDVMAEGELDEITREANKPGGENLQFEIDLQIAKEEIEKSVIND